jgi:molybdate transport system substrate-binding protein
MSLKSVLAFFCLLLTLLGAPAASADSLNVAVASNFAGTLEQLAARFKTKSGHEILISSASTGKIFTQIKNGAPFDVFMSADEIHADQLVQDGTADAGHAAIYALGRLVFVSNIKPEGKCQEVLSDARIKHLAIANPQTAPYGVAAQQVMERMKVWYKLQDKLVLGENIVQTMQFVASASANAGFVAKASLVGGSAAAFACEWMVPDEMYTPISQKMVVLNRSKTKPAVQAFWEFMQSAQALAVIRDSGYGVPPINTPQAKKREARR